MATTKSYKACFVPLCMNTTKSAPYKVFLNVPQAVKRRNRWFDAARRVNPKSSSTYFCCEDHFDLADDMENYVYYKMMGGPAKIKKTAVPHKFECQPSRKRRNTTAKRPASEKRRRRKEIDDILQHEAHRATLMDELDATPMPTADPMPEQSTIKDFTKNITKSTLTLIKREDATVTASTQTSVKQRSVAVQANIRPNYRSVHSMCKIKKSTADKCCSPVKFPADVEAAAYVKKLPSRKRFLAPKCISSSTTIFLKDRCGSNDLYVPTDDSHSIPIKNETLVKEAATTLNVTDYSTSTNPKAYLVKIEWSSLIDPLKCENEHQC